MKVLLVLIPLILILSGCVDNTSVDYLTGQAAGASSKNAEIKELQTAIKLQVREIRGLTKELERKTDVTREALENEKESLSIINENNKRLEAIELSLEYLDGNVSSKIEDLNTTLERGFTDLNRSISELNHS